ncbi:MAG: phosphodiester glycosidase family protein [Cyclobacteriaceae bacterium]
MRKLIFICVLFSTATNTSFAQSSIEEELKWLCDTLNPAMIHLKYHDSLFHSIQSINIISVPQKGEYAASISFLDSGRITLSKLAESQDAIAAINGTFFNMRKGGSVVFMQVNNKVINPPNDEAPDHIRRSAVAINDELTIIKKPETDWLQVSNVYKDIMVTGPLLKLEDQIVTIDSNQFNNTRHPRSAVCITNDNQLLFITVDGRHKDNAAGMTIPELQQLSNKLDCRDAINLDGGGSTTLWNQEKGVLNYPSDNKTFDHEGARAIANGIILKKVK